MINLIRFFFYWIVKKVLFLFKMCFEIDIFLKEKVLEWNSCFVKIMFDMKII